MPAGSTRRASLEAGNEERYRALLQSLSTFVWAADPTGQFTVPQPGWEKYTGHGFERHGGTGWMSDVHPDDRAHVAEIWKQAVESKCWFQIAWRCWHGRSRCWRRCVTSAVPMMDQDGVVREWIGAVLDTEEGADLERKRSQNDLAGANGELASDLHIMTRLQQLSTRLIQAGELNLLLGEILETALDLTRADKGNIQLFRDGALRIVEHRGFDAAFLDFFNNVQHGTAACGTALERKERVIVENVATDRIFTGTPALKVLLGAGVRAVQSTPLFDRSGRLLGMFSTHYSTPQRPRERDLRVIDLLARQTADLIERSLADQELRESRATLVTALASMTDAVFISDAQGRFLHANDTFATYHRFKKDQDISKNIDDCASLLRAFLPDGAEAPREMWAVPRALRGEAATNVEYTLERKDTGERWVGSYSFGPIRDKDGGIGGSVVVARDVTARKREEERFRSLISQSVAGIAECNPDGRFISVNDHFCKITGFTREELLSRRKEDITHPEDRPRNMELFRRCVERGEAFDIEKRYVTKDGSPVWVHNSVSPVSDPGGRLRSIVMICLDISDRKAAEARLARSERTLFELVERAPYGMYIVDSQFRIAKMNAVSQNGAFRNVRPVIGRDLSEAMGILWPEPVAAEIIAVFRHTLQTGEAYHSPRFVNPRQDVGAIEAYEWELHRMTLPDGRPGVICYYYDSTELRNTETALRRRTEELETILQLVPVPVWIARDAECREIYGNPAASALYGFSVSQNVSQSAFAGEAAHLEHFRDGRELKPEEHPIQRAIATGEPQVDQELEIHAPGGRRIVLYGGAVPLKDAAGRPRGAIAAMADISARKEWEERLKASEAQFKRLVESNIVGIVIANEKRVIDANNVYLGLLGYSREDLFAGRVDWAKATPLGSYQKDLNAIRQLREDGVCVPYEKEYYRPDGSRVPVLIGAATLPGYPELTWISFMVNMSEQKQLQNALMTTNEQLGRANKDLEQFAYSVSHDLQEPLRSIKIYSEVLTLAARERLDGEALQALDFVRTGATRMEQLLRDLLTYTRASRVDDLAEPVDARQCLQAALDNLCVAISETGAKIDAGALPPVRVHPAQLQQLFQNLIGNAIKYCKPEVSPCVRVWAERQDGWWRFSVKDNGIGIEPEYTERIFGLFKRLHTSSEYTGTGIGLALCYRIVEHYRGRIWVESQPGEGSTFHFTLPD
ncbi:MAG: PAS domain S-box protein [Bryobacterales bacterium]|nr:PAS domain S-box protein [Bryobacterales bacterium]